MHLVVILLGAYFKTEGDGNDREYINEYQFREIPFEADNKGHYQEIREIEQVFPCPQSFHIINNNQVEVQVYDGEDPGQLEFPSLIQVKGKDKKISRAKIYKHADIQAIGGIGDDAYDIGDEGKQDKLIETDHLPLSGGRIIFPQTRIDDVFIKRPGSQNQMVDQSDRNEF